MPSLFPSATLWPPPRIASGRPGVRAGAIVGRMLHSQPGRSDGSLVDHPVPDGCVRRLVVDGGGQDPARTVVRSRVIRFVVDGHCESSPRQSPWGSSIWEEVSAIRAKMPRTADRVVLPLPRPASGVLQRLMDVLTSVVDAAEAGPALLDVSIVAAAGEPFRCSAASRLCVVRRGRTSKRSWRAGPPLTHTPPAPPISASRSTGCGACTRVARWSRPRARLAPARRSPHADRPRATGRTRTSLSRHTRGSSSHRGDPGPRHADHRGGVTSWQDLAPPHRPDRCSMVADTPPDGWPSSWPPNT